MLYQLTSEYDDYTSLLADDPVRPHIPWSSRIGDNRAVLLLADGNRVDAVTCISLQSDIPVDEGGLFLDSGLPSVAVFYTIWSYRSGSGRQLILAAVEYIKEHWGHINRFVTLSPKTDMARVFHLRNGAIVYRENQSTVNYEYVGR